MPAPAGRIRNRILKLNNKNNNNKKEKEKEVGHEDESTDGGYDETAAENKYKMAQKTKSNKKSKKKLLHPWEQNKATLLKKIKQGAAAARSSSSATTTTSRGILNDKAGVDINMKQAAGAGAPVVKMKVSIPMQRNRLKVPRPSKMNNKKSLAQVVVKKALPGKRNIKGLLVHQVKKANKKVVPKIKSGAEAILRGMKASSSSSGVKLPPSLER